MAMTSFILRGDQWFAFLTQGKQSMIVDFISSYSYLCFKHHMKTLFILGANIGSSSSCIMECTQEGERTKILLKQGL